MSDADRNRPAKTAAPPAVLIRAAEGAHRGGAWAGSVSGEALDADALILFVHTDEVGGGPGWHVHPYDEVFVVTEGRARFTMGAESFEARAGDVVKGSAAVPHKYANLGPGPLRTIDIHLSRTWVQTDLPDQG